MKRFTRNFTLVLLLILFFQPLSALAISSPKSTEGITSLDSLSKKLSEEVKQLKDSSEKRDFLVQFHTDLSLSGYGSAGKSSLQKNNRKIEVVKALMEDANTKQRTFIEKLDKKKIEYKSFYVVNMIKLKTSYSEIAELAKDPSIKKVFLDRKVQVIQPEKVVPQASIMSTPLWNISQVGADSAWTMGYTGSGVVIGIIDSGADWSHPAIRSKFRAFDASNPSVPNSSELQYSWYDTVNYTTQPYDDNGHGTHCLGTMVGEIPGGSVIGVAPGAKWIAAKALDSSGSAYNSDLLSSGQWMMAPGGDPTKAPDVINNSWGGNEITSEWYRDMVASWRSAGIVPVFAAGNQLPGEASPWPGSIVGPAYYPESFAVAAVDSSNSLAIFSKLGPSAFDDRITKPEISAPGESIYSSLPGGTYGVYSGTSMAAPHVTGVIALMLSANQNLSVDELLLSIQRSATPLTSFKFPASPNMGFGYGLINARSAIELSRNGLTSGPLSGNVVDDISGKPILGARVSLLEKPVEPFIDTNEAGQFTFASLPSGKYTINVYHPRYGNTRHSVTVIGLETTKSYIRLKYAGTISGALSYDDGVAENAITPNSSGYGYGVVLKPQRFGLIKNVSAYFWGTSFPAIGGTNLRLAVYKADENMMPTSTMLIAPFDVTVVRGAMNTFDLSRFGVMTDQPFVAVFIQTSEGYYSPGIGIDETNQAGNKHSYIFNGYSFSPLMNSIKSGTFMIRAQMEYSMNQPTVTMSQISPTVLSEGALYTNSPYVNVSGTATNSNEIEILNNGNRSVILPLSSGIFAGQVWLEDGSNTLKAAALVNGSRLAYSSETKIILDQTSPSIALTVPEGWVDSKTYTLSGVVEESHLKIFSINDSAIAINTDGSFSKNLILSTGANEVVLYAEDLVGNVTEKRVSLYTDKVLDSIKITRLPSKLQYFAGDDLDLSGIEVSGTLTDGSVEILPVSESNVSGFESSLPAAVQTLTVRVEGHTALFNVSIEPKVLENITVSKLPTKTNYVLGDPLTIAGMELKGTFNNGAVEILPVKLEHIKGFDSSAPVTGKIITIDYEGVTTTFKINVSEDVISSPTGLKVVSTTMAGITISWDAKPGAMGYQVFRSATSDGTYTLYSTRISTSYTNTLYLSPGQTFYFKVRGYRMEGENKIYGEYSASVSAAIPLTSPTELTTSSYAFNNINLTWSTVEGAAGYQVYRASEESSAFYLLTTTVRSSYLHQTGVEFGKNYYYKVRAYQIVDGVKVFGEFCEPVTGTAKLATPSEVKALSTGYDQITVSWSPVDGASGYQVYRSTSATGIYSLYSTRTTPSYINSTYVTTGKTYYYKIRAYRMVGTEKILGSFSPVGSATVILPAPESPTANSASYNSISLKWNAVPGATGYQVYRSTSSSGTYSLFTTTTATNYLNRAGVVTGQTYYYKIRAYRTIDGTPVNSLYTAVISAKAVPSMPENPTASWNTPTSIQVQWDPVEGATGYQVYRSNSLSGTYSLYSTRSTTTYTNIAGIIPGQTYHYKIRAYTTVNTTQIFSDYSYIIATP